MPSIFVNFSGWVIELKSHKMAWFLFVKTTYNITGIHLPNICDIRGVRLWKQTPLSTYLKYIFNDLVFFISSSSYILVKVMELLFTVGFTAEEL